MGSFLRGISVGAGTVLFLHLVVDSHTATIIGVTLAVAGFVLSLLGRD